MALELKDKVRSIAKDLGFDECRFSVARKATHANQFQAWLDDGQNGDMKWMERSPERRKDPRLGTWFFLAELVTTLNLASDDPIPNRCGKCTQCIDCCPTQAITSPHHLDARRCISYFTIEHQGSIPQEFREAIGDRIFGCDDCLEVCPWNRFAKASTEVKFSAREYIDMPLKEFLDLSEENFHSLFGRSPVKRIGRDRVLRNVCIALGNT